MGNQNHTWVHCSPGGAGGPALRVSPLVAEQMATQKLLWIALVIASEVHDAGSMENPRPVSYQSPQVWRIEADNRAMLDTYGQLVAYYPDDGPILYAEGVFLFHDKECHPADGYPQVNWVVYRGVDGKQWYVVQESEYETVIQGVEV